MLVRIHGGILLRIHIGRRQRQPMSDVNLGDESIDRADLDARSTTLVPQRRGLDVIEPVRSQHG